MDGGELRTGRADLLSMRVVLAKIRPAVLFIGDAIIFAVGLAAGLFIRFGSHEFSEQIGIHALPFGLLFIVWLIVFYSAGLYAAAHGQKRRQLFYRVLVAFSLNAAIAVVFFYFIPFFAITPKLVLFLDIGITAGLLSLWRLLFNRVLERAAVRLAVFGSGPEVHELLEDIAHDPHSGFFLILHETALTESAAARLREKHVDVVTVSGDWRGSPELQRHLFKAIQMQIQFYDFADFYEEYFHRVPLKIIDRTWFLEHINEPAKEMYGVFKRICDVAGSVLALAIAAALFPLFCLIYAMEGMPPFFSQLRVGRYGGHFRIFKFRTMRREGDPTSITRLGSFLRLTHVDELPQAWNILRGEMSFIGPRPEMIQFHENLEKTIPFYSQRLLIAPGIMGWAQLHEPRAKAEDALSKLQYDLFYIKHRSLLLDVEILLKSIRHLLP